MPLTKLSSALYNMGGSDVGWHTERYCTDVSLRELLEAGGQKRALKLNLQSKGCGCPGCRTFAWEAWEEHGRSMGYGHSSLDQFCCFFSPWKSCGQCITPLTSCAFTRASILGAVSFRGSVRTSEGFFLQLDVQ